MKKISLKNIKFGKKSIICAFIFMFIFGTISIYSTNSMYKLSKEKVENSVDSKKLLSVHTSDTYETLNTKVTELENNTLLAKGKGGPYDEWLNFFGCVSGSNQHLYIVTPMTFKDEVSNITITSAKLYLTMPVGGTYIKSGNFETIGVANITVNKQIHKDRRMLRLDIVNTNSGSWGTTNNTVIIGQVHLVYTLT